LKEEFGKFLKHLTLRVKWMYRKIIRRDNYALSFNPLPNIAKVSNLSTVTQTSILNGDFHMVLLIRTKNKKSSLSTLWWSASNKGNRNIVLLL
jgi:hypothetical protein